MSKTMTMPHLKIARTSALAAMLPALLLAGCRVGPKYQVPTTVATAPPATYHEVPAADADGWKPAQPSDAMLRGKWWEVFGEPELNTLEDQLNANNQNIRVQFENFMAARELIAQARASLYPTVAVGPTYNRSGTSANIVNGTGATAGSGGSNKTTSVGSVPFSASWEPDLWGRVRNTIRENQYNAQLSAADLENERLTEQASLAAFFFELRGQDALRHIYDETIAADKQALEYNQAQYEFGITDKISVVEAQNTLQNAMAASLNLGVARAQYQHAIAMLIGVNPSSFTVPERAVLRTAPPLPIGIPSQLLQRRPDIAAAERQMAAGNAAIGVATAAYYPSLTLSATGGLQSSSWKHLFDIASRYWSIGPTFSETIYDAGLRHAELNQSIFTYNARVATYRQTVLTAFQQVEDGLSTVRILGDQIKQQQQAADSATEFVRLETDRFQLGLDPYIDVVTAQTTLLNDRQTLASLQIQQMTASVNLIEALGGGWDTTDLPTPADVSRKITRGEVQIDK
ncbi:MAG TPA: efflux transporter outer membrane subunit [Granulicella sp.]